MYCSCNIVIRRASLSVAYIFNASPVHCQCIRHSGLLIFEINYVLQQFGLAATCCVALRELRLVLGWVTVRGWVHGLGI